MSETLQPRDRLIPWYFVAFFLVIAAVDGVMATLAVRTQTGVVTDHAYEKGLAYNQVVAAEEVQEKLGWKGNIAFADNTLRFTLRDAAGKSLHPDSATAHFMRPTQDGMDFDVTLANGSAAVTLPAPGLWEVRVFAHVGKETYQQAKRIVAP